MPSTRPSAPETLGPLGLHAHRRAQDIRQARAMSSVWSAEPGSLAHDRAVGVHQPPFPPRPPGPDTRPSRSMESAPAQAGSSAGKWRPRSPRPAAPEQRRRPRRGPPRRRRCGPPARRRREWSPHRARGRDPGRPRSGGCRTPARRAIGCGAAAAHGHGAASAWAISRSAVVVTLMLRGSPGTTRTVAPERLHQPGVVGGLGPGGVGARAAPRRERPGASAPPPARSRSTVPCTASPSTRFKVSATATPGTAASAPAAHSVHHRPEQRRRRQRTGAVVHHDHLGRVGHRGQPGAHRRRPRVAPPGTTTSAPATP